MTLSEIRSELTTRMKPLDQKRDALLLESGRQAWRFAEHYAKSTTAVRIVGGYVVFECEPEGRVIFTGKRLRMGQSAEEWFRVIEQIGSAA